MADRNLLLKILDLARWAPSGDNTQPWRFEIAADDRIAVHGFDTRDHVLYDFDGHPSHLAHGALLETLRIAATGFGCVATWTLRDDCPDTAPVYDVIVRGEPSLPVDPLYPYIQTRVVQRRPMRLTALTSAQRAALAAAPGQGYEVEFFESATDRLRVARILWDGGYIRLTCPEAFEVHRTIIEWGARYSKDRIPERAVGVDPLTGRVMKWVMQRWERVDFFNRYLFGTLAPRVQLDFIPALACSAHLMLHAVPPPRSLEDYVRAGIAMQRLWLTAAAQGLHLQPEMTPVIFRWYRLAERRLSSLAEIDRNVQSLSANIESLLRSRSRKGLEEGLVFLGRVGRSAVPSSRSIRKDLADLMIAGSGVPAG